MVDVTAHHLLLFYSSTDDHASFSSFGNFFFSPKT